MTTDGDVLVIGYGNPGRLDDGLGPALAEAIEKLRLPGVTVEAAYQLGVEDAAEVARHKIVVFADASTNAPEPFEVKRIRAAERSLSFSSHSVRPEEVLSLAKELFQAEPEAWLMGIRGYEFNEFGERLCERARENLARAVEYTESAVRKAEFREVGSEAARFGNPGPVETKKEDDQCKTENI